MAEMTTDERRVLMSRGVLDAAGSKGYARAINVFTAAPAAGDCHLLDARSIPKELNAKKLVIHLGEGESTSFIIPREPVSCNWMAVPEGSLRQVGPPRPSTAVYRSGK